MSSTSSSISLENERRTAHLTGEQSGTGTEGARQKYPGWSLSDCQLLRGRQTEACWDNHDCVSHSQHDHPHGHTLNKHLFKVMLCGG